MEATFICELILERYISLPNTQKQIKISSYGQKKYIEFYSIYNGVCLKLLGSLLQKLRDFARLFIKMKGGFRIKMFDTLCTCYSVFVCNCYTVKMPLIH